MDNLNWVRARAACSLAGIYELLRDQVRQDVAERSKLQAAETVRKFDFHTSGSSFRATTSCGQTTNSVRFLLTEKAITVEDTDGRVMFSGSPAIADDGRCRLRIGSDELDLWQFRKRALEHLFFDV